MVGFGGRELRLNWALPYTTQRHFWMLCKFLLAFQLRILLFTFYSRKFRLGFAAYSLVQTYFTSFVLYYSGWELKSSHCSFFFWLSYWKYGSKLWKTTKIQKNRARQHLWGRLPLCKSSANTKVQNLLLQKQIFQELIATKFPSIVLLNFCVTKNSPTPRISG